MSVRPGTPLEPRKILEEAQCTNFLLVAPLPDLELTPNTAAGLGRGRKTRARGGRKGT